MNSKFRHLIFALCFAQTVFFAMNMPVSANTPDAVFSEEIPEDAGLAEDVFVPVDGILTDSELVVASGTCGKELGWSLDKYGNFTVYATADISASGKGYMTDWVLDNNVPWKNYRDNIKKVTLPDGIKSIGINAFNKCTNLERANFPNSIRTIGENAFSGCGKLTSADMKTGLRYIGSRAFGNCEALVTATIPETVSVIGDSAFYLCKSLKEINLPQTLIELGKNAFYSCESLKKVTIPPEIDIIPDGAFASCNSLQSVALHKHVYKISNNAFYQCESLKSLTMPSGLDTVGESAFAQCKSLSSVNFNTELRTVEASAFEDCTSLKSISLPQNVGKIGASAFAGCTSLTSANIPKTTHNLAGNAFAGDTLLKNFKVDPANENYVYDKNAVYTKDRETLALVIPTYKGVFEIPDGVKYIGEGAFSRLETLDGVKIPESTEQIWSDAFSECTGLTRIDFPESFLSIEDNAFLKCTNLAEVTFGNVTGIGKAAFRYTALTEAVIPESVTYIGEYAFSYCKSLKSVIIKGSWNTVPAFCFLGCEKLEKAELGEKTEMIDPLAFKDCKSLTEIYLPDSVQVLYNQAFQDSGLEKIRVSENLRKIFVYAFKNAPLKEFYYDSTPEKFALSEIYGDVPKTAVIYFTLKDSENNVALVTSDSENTLAAKLKTNANKGDILPESVKAQLDGKELSVLDVSLESALGQSLSPDGKLIIGTDVPDGFSENMSVYSLSVDGTLKALKHRYTHEKYVFETDSLGTFVFAQGAYTAGDIDGNGSVDIDDAILLFRHSMLPETYPIDYAENTDFNKDGKLDIDDAILLFRHSMLPDLYPID